MQTLISHPTGNNNVRAAINGLHKAGLLYKYYTSIAVFPNTLLGILGKYGIFSEVKRRSLDKSLQNKTYTYPWFEAGRLFASKSKMFASLVKNETDLLNINNVYQTLDKYVAREVRRKSNLSAVYCYEDGAEFSFLEAKKKNYQCLYDLPIGHWGTARRPLSLERERWPEWQSTLPGLKDSDKKLERKDNELRLADEIFVASSFTAHTLKDYPGKLASINIIPCGFPITCAQRTYPNPAGRPLKLLFVGSLSQRKGIADMFSAVENIGNAVELTIIGNKVTEDCKALNLALQKHTWIPSLPNETILQLMREQDVLLFPSLFEGFGLVITEAMSQGMPVITTNRTAGPDIIEHDKNGWLVEAGCTKALQAAIEKLLNMPEEISKAGMAAIETAKKRSWDAYGEELANVILQKYLTNGS